MISKHQNNNRQIAIEHVEWMDNKTVELLRVGIANLEHDDDFTRLGLHFNLIASSSSKNWRKLVHAFVNWPIRRQKSHGSLLW